MARTQAYYLLMIRDEQERYLFAITSGEKKYVTELKLSLCVLLHMCASAHANVD